MADSLNDTLPTYIHTLMFAPNVEALCTEEQRRYWLPRCESMEVCVCVCHGAFQCSKLPHKHKHAQEKQSPWRLPRVLLATRSSSPRLCSFLSRGV